MEIVTPLGLSVGINSTIMVHWNIITGLLFQVFELEGGENYGRE